MKTTVRLSLILILFTCSVFMVTPVRAGLPASTSVDIIGTIDGAAYHIRVPANWNGTLLVYARGWSFALPYPPDAAFGGDQVEKYLLARGYALAGSSFKNAGWAVKEGIHDTLALTNFFRKQIGEPEHIILYGESMGGMITAESIEKFPAIYDGGIPMCGPMAGSTSSFDYKLDVGLAYDVALGWPASWGTVEDPSDEVDILTEILPVVFTRLSEPANYGAHEFVRLVNDMTYEDFYLGSNQGYGFWVLSILMSYARGEVEVRAGGNPVQNIGRVYSLSKAEQAYLADLGVDAEPLLAAMNARTNISADVDARNYLEHYADFTGMITRPVLTVHTKFDVITPVAMESAYRDTVDAAGYADNLVQVYTEGVGHCSFTKQQLLAAIVAMETWLETGSAPGPDFFPKSKGFDNDYMPPPWPQP